MARRPAGWAVGRRRRPGEGQEREGRRIGRGRRGKAVERERKRIGSACVLWAIRPSISFRGAGGGGARFFFLPFPERRGVNRIFGLVALNGVAGWLIIF